jgi:hypothetical protein
MTVPLATSVNGRFWRRADNQSMFGHRLLRAAELPKGHPDCFLMPAALRQQPSFNPAKFGDIQCN